MNKLFGHGIPDKLKAVNHDQPPYSTQYPKLATILEDGTPVKSNRIIRNVIVRSGVCIDGEATVEDNFVTDEDPGFVDAEAMNFKLRDDSIVYEKIPGFQEIPFDKIGLHVDEYRTSLPDK